MAALQHTRTRSVRLGNTARTLQPSQVTQTQASQPGTTSPPAASSPIPVFLTNLRLLDFDLLPDWPGITPDIFTSPATGVQGQKKRIHCVEWSLFHLFELWDAEETATVRMPTSLFLVGRIMLTI